MTVVLPVSQIDAGVTLFRIVRIAHGADGALFFGPRPNAPPASRFDSAIGEFRVCYLAETRRGAFAEALLRRATSPDPATGIRVVATSDIHARAWAVTSTTRVLRLADLRGGAGLAPLGVTGALTMGDSHLESRRVSDMIHAADTAYDGIHYRARHDPDESAVALFHRADGALSAVTLLQALTDDLSRLGELLDWYRLGLDA